MWANNDSLYKGSIAQCHNPHIRRLYSASAVSLAHDYQLEARDLKTGKDIYMCTCNVMLISFTLHCRGILPGDKRLCDEDEIFIWLEKNINYHRNN